MSRENAALPPLPLLAGLPPLPHMQHLPHLPPLLPLPPLPALPTLPTLQQQHEQHLEHLHQQQHLPPWPELHGHLPPRAHSWGQPEGAEPIIDAARIPLTAFGTGRSRPRTLAMFAWLRVIRPALTLAVWAAVAWYAWPYVLGAPLRPEVRDLLVLYGFIVVFILIGMCIMAPLRWLRQWRDHRPHDDGEPSSLFALASFLEVAPARLSAWQRTRLLLVSHTPAGLLSGAVHGRLARAGGPPHGTEPPGATQAMHDVRRRG